MCNQIKITFFKFRRFILFYVAILVMVALGFYFGFVKIPELYNTMYDAFRETVGDTSFTIILALVSALFIGNDFSNRTIHHEITLGYSRLSVMLVRELPVMISSIVLHFSFVLSTVLGTACKTGFSTDQFTTADLLWSITIILQLIGLQSVITFITFICGKAPSAIAASVGVTFFTCNILRNFLDNTFFTKTVFYLAKDNTSDTLIPISVVAVITTATFIVLTYLVFRKKEIK